MQPGKKCGYEEDVNVPFMIRGPGIRAGATSQLVTTHTDLAPLMMSLIGESPRSDFDGLAFPIGGQKLVQAEAKWHEHVNIEMWGYQVRLLEARLTIKYQNTDINCREVLRRKICRTPEAKEYVQVGPRHRRDVRPVLLGLVYG
jgi:hypothetical protein